MLRRRVKPAAQRSSGCAERTVDPDLHNMLLAGSYGAFKVRSKRVSAQRALSRRSRGHAAFWQPTRSTRVSRTSDGRLRHHVVAGAGANAKRELPSAARRKSIKGKSASVRHRAKKEQPRSLVSSRQQVAAPCTLHPTGRAVAQAAAQTHRVWRGAAVGRTASVAAALARATILKSRRATPRRTGCERGRLPHTPSVRNRPAF